MYKPLPVGVTIRPSSIEGLGLFATEKFTAGTLIGRIHIPNENEPNGYYRTALGGFGNHSNNPNCYKLLMEDDSYWIGANQDIEPDDELTWYYTLYEIR
jgi:SET domain-containing protein